MEYIYNISELNKEYNGKTVLDIKQLNIPKGQITAIIGPSGAGKSTLLHILNHIEYPTKGTIIFDGVKFPRRGGIDIKTRREMVMVFQKPIVFNNNVYENIAYSLKIRKVPKEVIKETVQDIAEIVGLKDMLKQNAKTLSGGEAQRVALARAVILKPKVFLMDEVTNNLDPGNVILIENLIKHANLNYKTTIIMVTHNMNQARRLAHQVVFLLDGKLIEYGETNSVLSGSENQITQSFIKGDMIW